MDTLQATSMQLKLNQQDTVCIQNMEERIISLLKEIKDREN